jgi:simple sugar transport system permease protein
VTVFGKTVRIRVVLVPILGIVVGIGLGAVIINMVGESPVDTGRLIFTSAFGSFHGISHTLFYATPLIFTGLAVAVGFRGGLFNIGAEGQLILAAFVAALAGIKLSFMPAWALVPSCVLLASAAGCAWATIPAVLKVRFGVHEVINTIMMNFIAIGIVNYLVTGPFLAPGDQIPETELIAEAAHIPRVARLLAPFGVSLPSSLPLNASFLLAIAACCLVYVFLFRTKWGFEVRAVGLNPKAARAAGISVGKNVILAMAMSGALAGMVAVNEVMGYRYRYYDGFSPGFGFLGIAVALLGRNHPFGVLCAAILFGALVQGGLTVDMLTERVSKDIVYVVQGIIIVAVASAGALAHKPGKMKVREAESGD